MIKRTSSYKIAGVLIILAFNCTCVFAGRIIYIDDDAPADFNNIQAAIDDANNGDIVLVASGTHTGIGNRDISFKGKAITVKSQNGPKTCIIDCQGDGSNWHRGFVFNSHEDANSILTGLTITNGCALQGAGIFIQNSSPSISNCILQGNSCKADDEIYRNYAKAGAGIYINGGQPIISDCNISYNISPEGTTRGGGIFCNNAQLVISKCTINGNQTRNNGGGIYLSFCKDFLIEQSIICGNLVTFRWAGGIDISYSDGNIKNCLIAGNESNYGGAGVDLDYSDVNVINCSIANNFSSLEYSGGFYCTLSNINILNSILWGNKNPKDTQVYIYSWSGIYDGPSNPTPTINSNINMTFSDIQNDQNGIYISGEPEWLSLIWGDDNIYMEPFFADPNNNDYHLKSQAGRWNPSSESWVQDDVTSPCIDTGDPNSPIGLEPFPNGGRINMGAYGGTSEASKSYFGKPVCETIVAGDINGDCKVDFTDLEILMMHWLEDRTNENP